MSRKTKSAASETQSAVASSAASSVAPSAAPKKRVPKKEQTEQKVQAEVKQEVKSEVEKVKKPRKAKKEQETVEPEAPVGPEVSVGTVGTVETTTVDPVTGEKKRRVVSKESVEQSCKNLLDKLNQEIEALTSSEKKVKGVKFLKNLRKDVKVLLNDATKVLKLRKRVYSGNSNSGFMKEVSVSDDLANFLSLDKSKKYSRVVITKKLCTYITDHNLQQTQDRRIIVPNKDLSDLLQYKPVNNEPLTYFRLQRCIQRHILKE